MSCSINHRIVLLIFLAFVAAGTVDAQMINREKAKKKAKRAGFWKNWQINLNAGQTSFYGDVSIKDDNLSDKLKEESDWAFSGILQREMNPILTIGGQLMSGKLKGQNSEASFEGDILEANLNTSIDVVNLLLPGNDAGLHFYGFLGMGQFLFNSKLTYLDGQQPPLRIKTQKPEFVYMFGAGTFYRLSGSFDLTASMIMRQARNDKLDTAKNNNDWDYYTYLSAGVTYKINFKNKGLRDNKKKTYRFPSKRKIKIL